MQRWNSCISLIAYCSWRVGTPIAPGIDGGGGAATAVAFSLDSWVHCLVSSSVAAAPDFSQRRGPAHAARSKGAITRRRAERMALLLLAVTLVAHALLEGAAFVHGAIARPVDRCADDDAVGR